MHQIKRFHVEISTLCNSKCVTCPHSKINRTKIIDMARARKLITEDFMVYKDTLEFVEFHNYNEPLLTFDNFVELTELVNATYGKQKVGLVSNGSVMDGRVADKILTLDLRHIFFSIDGYSKEVYESHRLGLDRDVVFNNIDSFIDKCDKLQGIKPYLAYTVTPANQHEINDFKKHFDGRYCTICFQRCDGRGGVGKVKELKDAYVDVSCNYIVDNIYILSNFDVVPCCQDWDGKEVMGNLTNSQLKDIADNQKYNLFRERQASGRKRESPLCKNCKTQMIPGVERYDF